MTNPITNPIIVILLVLYLTDVALQLYACAKNKEKLRRITKILLMPLLALLYFAASAAPQPLVLLGILFGCLGDTFLLNHHSPVGFPAGLCAFFIGHVCYIILLVSLLPTVSIWLIALAAAVYTAGALRTFLQLKPHLPKNLLLLCLAYMVLLAGFSCIAALAAFTIGSMGAILLFCGTLFFLASDTVLSFNTFKEEKAGGNFIVMLTYIVAQSLIALGFLMILK